MFFLEGRCGEFVGSTENEGVFPSSVVVSVVAEERVGIRRFFFEVEVREAIEGKVEASDILRVCNARAHGEPSRVADLGGADEGSVG